MTLQTSPSQESRDIEVVPVLIMIIGNDRLGVSRRLGHGYGDLVMRRGVEGVGGRGGVAGGVGRLINGLFCYRLGLGLGKSRHLDEDAAGGSRLLELFAGEPGADGLRCDVNAGNHRLAKGRGQHPLAAFGHFPAEAGGDDGDLDLVAHAFVEHRAEDDVGVFVGGVLDERWRPR